MQSKLLPLLQPDRQSPQPLSEEVIFRSPVKDYHGPADVAHLLSTIGDVLDQIDAQHEFAADREVVTIITAVHGGEQMDGVIHETHDAALRWSTILAVATHIVEQQAPDLPPKEIIKALKAGLDAQSPADVRELLPQASVGDPPAMYRLARLLKQNGRPDESERWLRSAAEAGHPGALYTLGKLAFEQGRHREAELWLRGAADAGHADAMYSLWTLLHEEDRLTARAWLRKAADAGNRDAMYELWTLHQGRDEREAERWLRRAANNGHRQALADLGRLAAERGAEDDAVRWLRRAAEEGDSSAMSQYELMLFERRRRERGPARHAG